MVGKTSRKTKMSKGKRNISNLADWNEYWDNFNTQLYIRVITIKNQVYEKENIK